MNFGVAAGPGGPGEPQPACGSRAELVCCGHPPPLLLRDGSAVFIEPSAAPPLGLLDLAEGWCKASMIGVGEGDRLLLYTDGVSEARDGAGRFFPLAEQTARALRAGQDPEAGPAAPHVLDALVASLRDHAGDRVTDDIMLLLVTLRLAAGHRQRELGHCYHRAGSARGGRHETMPWEA